MRSLPLLIESFAQTFRLNSKEFEVLRHLALGNDSLEALSEKTQNNVGNVEKILNDIFEKTKSKSKASLLSELLKFSYGDDFLGTYPMRAPVAFVVEDEADLCDVVAENLELSGLKVYRFTDPRKVKAAMRTVFPDVIVSDYNMTSMNGLQLLDDIRQHYGLLPGFVFLSARPEALQLEASKRLQVFSILEKPVDFEKLNQSIREFFLSSVRERNRYIRVDANLCFKSASLLLQTENIGYGGVFVKLNSDLSEQDIARLAPGKKLKFEIMFEGMNDPKNLEGQVVWNRKDPLSKKVDGAGLRFLNIPAQIQNEVLEFVRTKRLMAKS